MCSYLTAVDTIHLHRSSLIERERALKTPKGQFGMSIINQVLLNIKWQHRWQDPNPSTFWYDVKKPGPHRALSPPGSRRHPSPAWPQLGQFRSERTSLPARQNDQRKKTQPRQTSGKHWWLLSLHLYADVEDCLCFGSQTATLLRKFLDGKNTCMQANAKYKPDGGKFLKLTDNKQTELLPLLISIQQPSPDFACSRRGLGKGGRCHAVATDLKMVYIPCYVSITTVTCLRESLRKWRGKRDVATEIIFTKQCPKRTTHDSARKCLAKVDWIPSDHIISNYVLL